MGNVVGTAAWIIVGASVWVLLSLCIGLLIGRAVSARDRQRPVRVGHRLARSTVISLDRARHRGDSRGT